MSDISHIDAIYQAVIYENLEPLIAAVERGEAWVIENDIARKLIAEKLRRSVKSAHRPKKDATKSKNRQRAALAWFYHGMGYPKWNNPDLGSPMSACRKASEELTVGESSVKTAMKEFEITTLAKVAYEFGAMMKNQSK